MKRKPRISTILFVLLLLVGLGILLFPTANDLYTRRKLSEEVSQYNEVAKAKKADYSEMWEAAEEYNQSLLEKKSQFTIKKKERKRIKTLLNPLGNGMMGYIEIPKISVNLPIYQGTEEKELQSGAGYWLGSSLPTGGESTHCIITAHTGLVKGKFFTDIDKLKEGDVFLLHVLDRDLAYEVDQILITEPDELEPLYIVEGQDYVTLYTCYPYGVNTQRLLVRGHRTELTEKQIQELSSRFPWWVLIVLAVIVLLGILYYWRKKKRKPKKVYRVKIAIKEKGNNQNEE